MAANGTAPTLATDPDITFEEYADRIDEEIQKAWTVVSLFNFDDDTVFGIIDTDGDAALQIWDDGRVSFTFQRMMGLGSWLQRSRAFGFSDVFGNVAVTVGRHGELEAAVADIASIGGVDMRALRDDQVATPTFDANLYHLPISGQSLGGGQQALPLDSLYAEAGCLMFAGGVRAFQSADPDARASLVGLAEAENDDNGGETIASGMCTTFRRMIAVENGIPAGDPVIRALGSSSFVGATKIADLDKPSANYTNLMADVAAAYALRATYGPRFKVPWLSWLQGEEDVDVETAPATYKPLVTGLQTNFEADTNAITGRSDVIPLLMYQNASWKAYGKTDPAIARAQLDLFGASGTKILMPCPGYIFDYTDDIHLYGFESRRMGAYFGWMGKRIEIDRVPLDDLRPMEVTANAIDGDEVELTIRVRHGGLKFEFRDIIENSYGTVFRGFELFEDDGTTPITITGMEIWPPRSNKLIVRALGASITAGCIIQAGHSGEGTTGRRAGPRINLRDEQGESQIHNGYRIHNYMPVFRRTLT